jgi:hypothetical protein
MKRQALSFALVGSLAAAMCAASACGNTAGNSSPTATGAGSDGGGEQNGLLEAGPANLLGNDASSPTGALTISPANATLTVTAPGAKQQFTASLGSNTTPAIWSIGTPGIGTIDKNGLFTASGAIGGLITVAASANGQMAQTGLTVNLLLTENPGAVSAPTQGLLQAGAGDAGGDPAFTWLYPYDQTVFPQGISPPTLQFGGAAFDAAMVKVSFSGLTYTGFYGPSNPGRVALSAKAWTAITGSAGGTNSIKISVTKISAGVVSGPITESWIMAPGSLAGSLYYNSYNSPLANNTGAVLKLSPGQAAPTIVIPTQLNGQCHVCHAVSANGTTMVAANELVSPPMSGYAPTDGVYDLTKGATKIYDAPDRTWDFGALYPDGTKFLRYGAVPWADPSAPWAPDVRGLGNGSTDVPSALFTPTGTPISAPGLDGTNLNMMMPAFSPDGKEVAFTHYDTGLGHTIAVMDFDNATNTFSNLRDVANIPTAFIGWPSFTPDDQYVLFASGTSNEYDSLSDNTAVEPEPTSDIYIAHVPTKTIASADQLNGVLAGKTYLPFPDDPHLNFEPTILPVAAGGYYWVVFTSRRNYGNVVNGDPFVGTAGAPSPRKKLWVSALTIPTVGEAGSPTTATDITHPAFFVDGQELSAGNMRAFWALDPCVQVGTTCSTGSQCCSGFCRETPDADGGEAFTCITPPSGCSQNGEKCSTAANCCEASTGTQCINGYCSIATPK